MKDTHPPIWQTPGKLQYYKAEMEPYLPGIIISAYIYIDEIKWQIRMPSRFAQSSLKMTYLDKVKEETTKFLNERIKHNFLKPDQGLNLDLTLKDAELLISAN